ncbi:hypothetical protein BJ138DRAFT_627964 [Hygrophoropsis aurantiaca]|uniref:Uncharacterized protein n=1 Tax=Hygrophoropsis aurantiaca TaxID=72124 RepID=A0ACB8A1F0_9AGAM|nr:hypothetical protein BJ138DRAFT_627964 [Hygrophoropsis aurantiaca]
MMGEQTRDQDINSAIKLIEEDVFELEKQESELLARLRYLQDMIARRRAHAGNLKNSLAPIHRLPIEILQSCFYQVLEFWLNKQDRTESDLTADECCYFDDPGSDRGNWLHTPAVAVSHVSHHWRQLAINMPSLWTNITITPSLDRHMDVFQEFLRRVDSMPIVANFQNFESQRILSSTRIPVVEAIIPLVQAQQVATLAIIESGPMFSHLLSRVADQPIIGPPLCAFSSLTSLAIHDSAENFSLRRLKSLLSATPKLECLTLNLDELSDSAESADKTIVNLPSLQRLTLMNASHDLHLYLSSLSIPNLQQLILVNWYPDQDKLFFFVNDSPRFPQVRNLTLHVAADPYIGGYSDEQFEHLSSAFPGVTHLTLRHPYVYHTSSKLGKRSSRWSNLQHLTLHFAFAMIEGKPHRRFAWLPERDNQVGQPLHICVRDNTAGRSKRGDMNLFHCYRELQEYGTLEGSRLEAFLRWQAGTDM